MKHDNFDVRHNEAFDALGARAPGQHWSSFDVARKDARAGKAKLFVTTLWNFHSREVNGQRVPTEVAICRDCQNDSLWYEVPKPGSAARKTHVAHWDGIELSVKYGIPMVGVLKDVRTRRCALECVFDISEVRYQADQRSMWPRIAPRSAIDFGVRCIDIEDKFMTYPQRKD